MTLQFWSTLLSFVGGFLVAPELLVRIFGASRLQRFGNRTAAFTRKVIGWSNRLLARLGISSNLVVVEADFYPYIRKFLVTLWIIALIYLTTLVVLVAVFVAFNSIAALVLAIGLVYLPTVLLVFGERVGERGNEFIDRDDLGQPPSSAFELSEWMQSEIHEEVSRDRVDWPGVVASSLSPGLLVVAIPRAGELILIGLFVLIVMPLYLVFLLALRRIAILVQVIVANPRNLRTKWVSIGIILLFIGLILTLVADRLDQSAAS